jgi:peptide deformylase
VIDLNILAEEKPEFKGFKKAFINAKIVERSEELESCEEGCLSLPGINEMVKRPKQIRIQYYNENFEFFDEVYDGYKARVIQHEYDHLEGLMFIDHVSPIRRQMNKGKLSNMAKGKLRCRYNVKTA